MTTLPEAFVRQTEALIGPAETAKLCEALTEPPPVVSLRVNPLRHSGGVPCGEAVPWCATGRYLTQRPRFTFDPALHAGAYYVQEASSMFIEQAMRAMQTVPARVLDLCAAPGGKSTLWRTLLPQGALLVANEPLHARAQILAENLTKWGQPDTIVTCAYPEAFAPLAGFFDVIAADVPCSGEGMFRKDEGARAEWSPEAVAACAQRQWDIVASVWPALREGGYLVYSTCTFNRAENEDNVARICRELGAEPVAVPAPEAWGIGADTTGRGLPVAHFYPHSARGEGFFMALLRKTGAAPAPNERKKRRTPRKDTPVSGAREVAAWLSQSADFKLFCPAEGLIAAIRQSLNADMERVCATVQTITAGVAVAQVKGRKLIPQHALALSTALAPDAFPQVELPYSTAIAYLRREAIVLPPDTPRGYVIVTYGNNRLGFVNNLGNRANNLYPNEWRIRTAPPADAPALP